MNAGAARLCRPFFYIREIDTYPLTIKMLDSSSRGVYSRQVRGERRASQILRVEDTWNT